MGQVLSLARVYPGKSLFDPRLAAMKHGLVFNPLPTLQMKLKLKTP